MNTPAPQTAITRAILSGALQKANDAVHADGDGEWDYAADAYVASCDLLVQVMGRLEQGGDEWMKVEGIVSLPCRHFLDVVGLVD